MEVGLEQGLGRDVEVDELGVCVEVEAASEGEGDPLEVGVVEVAGDVVPVGYVVVSGGVVLEVGEELASEDGRGGVEVVESFEQVSEA